MINIKHYVKAESVEQAYTLLNEKRSNKIIGGMMWLRQGRQYVNTAIDLKNLGLDQIRETKDQVEIGAMVTLRQLETSTVIKAHFPSLVKSVQHIVGVQFRNMATIGGSVFSRFGFSNILTAILPLDATVVLHQRGRVKIEEFINLPMDKDVLTHIIIKKNASHTYHGSLHKSSSDIPIIAVGAACVGNQLRIAVGARPRRPMLWTFSRTELDKEAVIEHITRGAVFGSNTRGSAAYRQAMTGVLIQRYFEEHY